jgi:glycosyltransferase involved in cell wall biosynthesis
VPQFVLIDHSLSGPGSHHYEYATHILNAADAQGFATVLASNRRFQGSAGLPERCRILPLFQHSTYGGNSLATEAMNSAGNRQESRINAGFKSCLRAVRQWRRRYRHDRRLAAFAAGIRQLFEQLELRPGDHVFVPTLSDFDLLGLGLVIPGVPRAQEVDWHLQCHFSFLEGRETDYRWQSDRLEAMRERFRVALAPLAGLRLHFYSTTQQMAAQYNRLGQVRFDWLPYPVNEQFRPLAKPANDSLQHPLRIVCAGGIRDEKGSHAITDLVQQLWTEYLEPGRIQIVVQGSSDDLQPLLRRDFVPATNAEIESGDWPVAPIVQAAFPLSMDGYQRFIRGADVGLFLYDSYRYYGRCSGVLVEMLCAGVPIVVPGGCWLHDEIAAPIQVHATAVARGQACGQHVLPLDHAAASRSAEPAVTVQVPKGAAAAVLEIDSPDWRSPRRYFGVEATQLDADGRAQLLPTQIVAAMDAGVPTLCCLPLSSSGGTLQLRVWNAFEALSLRLHVLRLTFVAAEAGTSVARGAVGAVYMGVDVADAVRDVARNYAQYAESAEQFSGVYRRLHQAQHAVGQMIERSCSRRRDERRAG